MKLTEKRLSGKELYHGKIIRVQLDEVELENGAKAMREVVRHPGGVCAAILTEKDELLFVRQFRYPYAQVVLECPAGKLEPGEDPDEAIQREQKEETGTTSSCYIKLGELYPTPGYCGEVIHLYLAAGLRYGEMDPDEDEFLEVEKIPLEEAVRRVLDNEIPDAKTQTAVLKAAMLRQQGKRQPRQSPRHSPRG